MRKMQLGCLSLVVACSSGDYFDGALHSREQNLSGDAGGRDADAHLIGMPAEQLELPYTYCSEAFCEVGNVLSNVSPATLVQRALDLPQDEFARDQEERLHGIRSSTEAAVAHAAELVESGAGDEMLAIALALPEPFFDFRRLRGLGDEEHGIVWGQRVQQLAAPQEAARALIQRLGGTFQGQLTLSNIVYARLPARNLAVVLQSADVLGMELLNISQKELADGVERRRALAMNDDALQFWGWDGNEGSNSNLGPIRFAVVELDDVVLAHKSFNEGSSGSRANSTWACTTTTCSAQPGTYNASGHSTRVSSVLLSDYADSQVSVADYHEFGGIAPEGALFHYEGTASGTTADTARAIDSAVARNLDIVNISLAPTTDYCQNSSHGGVMESVRAATDAGVLTVVGAGNDFDLVPGACTVSSYGAFPDTLTVGGLADVTSLASLDAVATYYASGSNLPGETTTIAGGVTANQRMVDVVATAFVDNVANTTGTAPNQLPTDSGVSASGFEGTSYAAPQVAAAAGLLKDWAAGASEPAFSLRTSPYWLKAMIALMADGSTAGGSGWTTTGVDYRRGFGSLRFTLPAFLGSDGYQRSYEWTADEGDAYETHVGTTGGAEPATMQGWKFVALADVNTYGSAPALTVTLIDKCPPGGGTLTMMSAQRVTHKARLRLAGSQMASFYHNRCLWVRVKVDESNGLVPITMVQEGYSNSRINHDMP